MSALLALLVLFAAGCDSPSSNDDSRTPPSPPYAGPELSVLGSIATDEGDRVDVDGDQTYNPIDGPVVGSGDSVIEGIMMDSSPDEFFYVYGSYDAGEQTITITQTVGSVIEGPRSELRGTTYFGDAGNLASQRKVYFATERNTSMAYGKVGGFNGGGRSVGGPFGVSTAPADMPDSGEFIVTDATIELTSRLSSTHVTAISASAEVDFDADFAAGTVDFRVTPTSGSWPFDYIQARNLQISGNAFTGGDVDAYQELSGGLTLRAFFLGVPAEKVTNLAGGVFFGPADPVPAEVGVSLLILTESGARATARFVAKRDLGTPADATRSPRE